MRGEELTLRIVVREPPEGVRWALQRGDSATAELLPPARAGAGEVEFECVVRVDGAGAAPRFLGPCVHGPTDARFVYLTTGPDAATGGAPWTRRAKVGLRTITLAQVRAALAEPGAALETTFAGTARDGGAACATVPLPGGWRLVRRAGHA